MKISELRLYAGNSSGTQTLYCCFDECEDSVFFTLHGDYEGEEIQIDFDEVDQERLINFLQNTLHQLKKKT